MINVHVTDDLVCTFPRSGIINIWNTMVSDYSYDKFLRVS